MSSNREILDAASLPQWQSDLIKQILYSLESYYCRSEQFDLKKESIVSLITQHFNMINHAVPASKINTRPKTLDEYKIYLRMT